MKILQAKQAISPLFAGRRKASESTQAAEEPVQPTIPEKILKDYLERLKRMQAEQDVFYSRDPNVAILAAASNGDLAKLKELVEDLGTDVNVKHHRTSNTPLIEAAVNGHAAAVTYLLERGADHRHANAGGNTALDLARLRGKITDNAAVIQILDGLSTQ